MSVNGVTLDVAPNPTDEIPSTQYEFHCEKCGVGFEHSGRGRKPKYCPEHRGTRSSNTTSKVKGTNEQLAAQALEVLCGFNGIAAFGMRLMRLTETGQAITDRETAFREQAYLALLMDPKLCQTILKSSGTSGIMGLFMAYGMLGAAIAPVAMNEIKALRAEAEKVKLAEAA